MAGVSSRRVSFLVSNPRERILTATKGQLVTPTVKHQVSI
jgi:hypothetical protein